MDRPEALPIDHPTRAARVGTPVGRATDNQPAQIIACGFGSKCHNPVI